MEGTNLPAELKLRSTRETMQYAPVKLGDTEFLLPASSVLTTTTETGEEAYNSVKFEQCRQYTAKSTISFGAVEEGGRQANGTEPINVPSGVQIDARLRDSIAYATVAGGDPIYLVVKSDLKQAGRVLVPRGAVLSGRITRVTSYTIPRCCVYFGVAVRFDTIAFGGRHGQFSGTLASVGKGPYYLLRPGMEAGETYMYVEANTFAAGTPVLIRCN